MQKQPTVHKVRVDDLPSVPSGLGITSPLPTGHPPGIAARGAGAQLSPTPIRVALLDPDASGYAPVRQAFQRWARGWTLQHFPTMTDALDSLPGEPPQIILMEPWLGGHLCLRSLRQLKARVPDSPVVMCTARSNAVEVLLSFAAGADGFIIKPIPPRELVGAISQVVEGATFLCARTQNLLGCSLKPKCIRTNSQVLTFREEDVMGCLLQHHSNKQIAEQLGMKGGTVHAHLTNLFGKLKAHTRAQACRKYQRGT